VAAATEPYRVMVVDDSAVIRGFFTRYLEADGTITVVSTASNGAVALANLADADPDVVVLDIEMPEMDGMTALPKILAAAPDVKIVVASTLTQKNAELSLRCIREGAADFVPKPLTKQEVNTNQDFRRELVEKVKVYAAARREARGAGQPGGRLPDSAHPAQGRASPRSGKYAVVDRTTARSRGARGDGEQAGAAPTATAEGREIVLREPSAEAPEILVIGASTGGPQALIQLFGQLRPFVERLPVLVVQHMPATFTTILADHIARASGMPAAEAEEGLRPRRGEIYVAPGGYHMTLRREGGGLAIGLDQNPPENFCRPALDPLLRSLAQSCGSRAMAAILTGMGHDGLRGARELAGAGATLIAQDEASSVVWGMPGAVATAGLASAVVPLSEVAPNIGRILGVNG